MTDEFSESLEKLEALGRLGPVAESLMRHSTTKVPAMLVVVQDNTIYTGQQIGIDYYPVVTLASAVQIGGKINAMEVAAGIAPISEMKVSPVVQKLQIYSPNRVMECTEQGCKLVSELISFSSTKIKEGQKDGKW